MLEGWPEGDESSLKKHVGDASGWGNWKPKSGKIGYALKRWDGGNTLWVGFDNVLNIKYCIFGGKGLQPVLNAEQLARTFVSLDVDGDEQITKEEVVTSMMRNPPAGIKDKEEGTLKKKAEARMEAMFFERDSDKDGAITWKEFVEAETNEKLVESEDPAGDEL